ncbi:MAG: RHS repeat-associated core domain-containing protein [Terriglobales bacterium]
MICVYDAAAADSIGARYYTSAVGRFLTPDWSAAPEATPYADLSNPQSLNLYGYVLNNPATATDPDGHWCFLGFGSTCSKSSGGLSASAQSLLNWALQTLNGAPPVSLEAAQDFAMDAPEFQPGGDSTHCNQATLCIAEATHNPTGPLAGSANQQAAELGGSPDHKRVTATDAQKLANQGTTVFAVWMNPGGHGHTATVRALGVPGDTPKAGSSGPLLNDIGGSDDTGIMGANWAFPKGANVTYYVKRGGGDQ